MPDLPYNLKHLYCQKNKLYYLPILPENLEHLYYKDNYIITLPLSIINCKKLKYIDMPTNIQQNIDKILNKELLKGG